MRRGNGFLMKSRLGVIRQVILIDLFRAPIISFVIAQGLRVFRPRRLSAFKSKTKQIHHEEYSKSHVSRILIRPLTRSTIPISLASAISWPQTNSHAILLVGPRYESDYFLLRGYGFSANKIKLLDQFSTSPRIEVGDAHEMRFADETFDIVILSWCLAYSGQPARMVGEAWRTLKANGVLIICNDSQQERSPEDFSKLDVGNLTSANTVRFMPEGATIFAHFDSPVGPDGRRSVSCVAARKVR